MKLILKCVVSAVLLSNCGRANFNRIFGSEDNSTSGLMTRAQLAYDLGEYDDAEELALKAYESTTSNGDPAILLGNIMLSKAGVDVFQLVGKLADLSSGASSTGTSTDSCASSGSSSSAAGSLSQMSCKLITLSASEVAALGSDIAVTSPYLGVSSYYSPANVTDELRAQINVLNQASKGVRYLCPFINRESILDSSIDERHVESVCPDKTGTIYSAGNAHITFAMLHLIETLVYQRGILIDGISSPSTSGKSGISTISTNINAANFGTDIAGFVSAVSEFKSIVDAVANTANSQSQIALALDGLTVVVSSFTQAGVPASVTAAISSGLDKIKQTADKLATAAGSVSNATYQTQALKGQINEKYATKISSKMNTVCGTDGATCTDDQKTALCTSYTDISQGVDPSKVSKPSWCS